MNNRELCYSDLPSLTVDYYQIHKKEILCIFESYKKQTSEKSIKNGIDIDTNVLPYIFFCQHLFSVLFFHFFFT